jgi:hypothetical protein
MERRHVVAGTKVVATRALGYAVAYDAPVAYIEPGTAGVILSVVAPDATWSLVKVQFDGHARVYNCDMRAAEFGLALAPTPIKWAEVEAYATRVGPSNTEG